MKLTHPDSLTVQAVWRAMEREAEQRDWRRPHLGASILGKACDRAIWFSFRWVQRPSHDGQTLAIFDRGKREEPVLASRLRAAGVKLSTADPATGGQYWVSLAPHIGGSADFIAENMPDFPGERVLLDAKTAKKESYEELLKKGAREWNVGYFVQLQLYYHDLHERLGLTRMALLVVCKNDERIKLAPIDPDPEVVRISVEKGRRIVAAEDPPQRISNDPTWYGCKFCDHQDTCQLGQYRRLERNCRTCISSTPKDDGTWFCEHHERTLGVAEQKAGCESHLMIPSLLPRDWEATDLDEETRSVQYRDANGNRWTDSGGTLKPQVEG